MNKTQLLIEYEIRLLDNSVEVYEELFNSFKEFERFSNQLIEKSDKIRWIGVHSEKIVSQKPFIVS